MNAARSFLASSLGLLLGIPAWAGIPADLKVLRRPGSVQLVLMGMGANPEIRMGQQGAGLEIEVTTSQATELAAGIRQLSLTDVGFASVELDGGGNRFVLRVQPVQGRGVPKPVVTDDGQSVRLTFAAQTMPQQVAGSYNIRTPGQVPVSNFVPPLRQRAYAPPVGDMAVGTMVLRNPSYVALKGPPVTLTTRNASARDVLMLLAQMGGYNFAFADVGAGSQIGGQSSSSSGSTQSTSGGGVLPPGGGLVTVAFQREPLERDFNFVLLSSGLQAKLEERTVVVGLNVLAKTIGNQVSRVYRLNQVLPDGAADYLANLGATITKTNTITSTSNESSSTGVSTANASASTSSTSTQTVIESFGASQGPLKGLIGTTDKRLGTITLIGGSYLVSVAEGYLKQLDLRKRQVAVNVKILNIDLDNASSIDNSFTAQIGDTFIVNASGQALVNFGTLKPSSANGEGLGLYSGATGSPLVGAYPFRMPQDQQFFDVPNSATPYSPPKDSVIYPYGNAGTPGTPVRNLRPGFGPYNAPWQTGQLEPIYDETNKEVKKYNLESPKNLKYPPNKIFDYLAASVISGNAKSLADPTLLVQEGESAKVEAVTSVITNVSSTSNSNNTTTSSTTRENAGLTLKVDVIKIDDNGFVTLNLRPEVSIANPSGGEGLVGGVRVSLNNITKRSLDSGKVRLRDGQALFLTGVMQENMFTSATKWPVLGDLPFFGQFFRKTNTGRRKSELVIVVTPRIIDDEQAGSYGYGFQPSSAEARRLIYPQ